MFQMEVLTVMTARLILGLGHAKVMLQKIHFVQSQSQSLLAKIQQLLISEGLLRALTLLLTYNVVTTHLPTTTAILYLAPTIVQMFATIQKLTTLEPVPPAHILLGKYAVIHLLAITAERFLANIRKNQAS